MTDPVYTDISKWINAYHAFSAPLLSKPLPRKWYVPDIQKSALERFQKIFDGSEPSQSIALIGHGGCGKTTLLTSLVENEAFTKRHQIIYTSLIRSLHLLDVSIHDMLMGVCIALMKALKQSDMEPPVEAFQHLIHPLLKQYALDDDIAGLPDRLLSEIKVNTPFRKALRRLLEKRSDDLVDLINQACQKIIRNTYGCFKLDDHAIQELKHEEVSDAILSKLADLKGRECRSEVTFIREVEKRIGNIQTIHYKPVMLKHAWSETEMRPVVLMDDMDKLPWPVISQIFYKWPDFFSSIDADLVLTPPLEALYHFPPMDENRLGEPLVLSPLILYDEAGHVNAEAFALMKQVVSRRLDGLPADDKALDNMIKQSGGVIRNLIHTLKQACSIVIEKKRTEIDEEIASKTAEAADAFFHRFFDFSIEGPMVETLLKNQSIKEIPSERREYLIRNQFVIRYGEKETECWYDASPCLKKSLTKEHDETRESDG